MDSKMLRDSREAFYALNRVIGTYDELLASYGNAQDSTEPDTYRKALVSARDTLYFSIKSMEVCANLRSK